MLCKRLSLNHTHAEEDRMISTENLLFRRTLLLQEKLQVHAKQSDAKSKQIANSGLTHA